MALEVELGHADVSSAVRAGTLALGLLAACAKPEAKLLPWQERASTLPMTEHAAYRALREAFAGLEAKRGVEKKWPEAAGLPVALTWSKLERGSYINYLGAPPPGSSARRWLVLIIEPEAGLLTQAHEPVPKPDEEHHVLPDGTLLHVTLWSAPNEGALPVVPMPLPGEDGWTQAVGP